MGLCRVVRSRRRALARSQPYMRKGSSKEPAQGPRRGWLPCCSSHSFPLETLSFFLLKKAKRMAFLFREDFLLQLTCRASSVCVCVGVAVKDPRASRLLPVTACWPLLGQVL